MDWLDIVPALSKYGFGKGEVAIIIKQVSEFISATYVMNFIGIIFTLIIIFTALILLKVVIDNYFRLLLVEENKQKEESLRRYQVEAIKSRYFLEIKHLVHDLKTPLVTIQGLGEVIKLKTRNQKILEYTERIINSAEKMSEMISEILNETKMDIINMKELFDFIKIQLSLNEVTSKIIFEISPDLKIYGNKVRLSRAIINLIENGFRAINSENGRILVKAWGTGNKVMILVEDNGVGISEDAIDRVWDAGYTTNLEHTGLGLYFVKEVLNSHHGEIVIKSKVNIGTKVMIFLPPATE
jgi:signal transduction histidine kinase